MRFSHRKSHRLGKWLKRFYSRITKLFKKLIRCLLHNLITGNPLLKVNVLSTISYRTYIGNTFDVVNEK